MVNKATLPFRATNKVSRQAMQVKRKKAVDAERRDERLRRKREEAKDPSLREDRLRRNKTATLETKRQWDDVGSDVEDGLGLSVDVGHLKKLRSKQEERGTEGKSDTSGVASGAMDIDDEDNDNDSMLDSESEDEVDDRRREQETRQDEERPASPMPSTASTNLDYTPEHLAKRFPSIFKEGPPTNPKILITTSLNSTLHKEGELLTDLLPYSTYIPRSSHRYGHKFSVREICSFAANRAYTAVVVLEEDQKRPCGMTMVHLPAGPTFHFSISNWIEGRKMPGHGRPTEHIPELILNNFRTPLGLLTAHFFRTLFPPQPELQGRQVVTLHNQRDYIFLRRHRYVFREKRATEKRVVGPDGKEVQGMEDIRAGLQELGPRFTLKLRRVDKGIQRASGQEWQWKGRMEKTRTKFQL